ncbi:ester cyclase [Pseudomonas sp. Marseille-QA0892]
MTIEQICAHYRAYLDCLNSRHWESLGNFVHADAHYNGERVGLKGYRAMLEADVRSIPDLHFALEEVVAEPPVLAARLFFACTPVGVLFDLPVNGRRVEFSENVFYRFKEGRIHRVWSVIDKAAVAHQVAG